MNLKPSKAQISAGNYKMRHDKFQGLDISIENPKGSERRGIGKDGNPWSVKMPHDYGYIKGTEGADGDHVDVYVGHHKKSPHVFVIDQHDCDSGKFDEHKCMLGFANADQAAKAYDKGFSDNRGEERRRSMLHLSVGDFKEWLKAGNAKKSVKGFASGGRINKANGGMIMLSPLDQSTEPAIEEQPSKPKEEGWLSSTIKDMGREAYKGFDEARQTIREGIGPEVQKRVQKRDQDPNSTWIERNVTGPIGDTGRFGAALAAVPGLAINPLIGAAKSLYANIETPAAEAVINRLPQKEGYEFPREKWRESAKEGFETALNAGMPGRRMRLPTPAGRPVPPPETIGDFNVPLTRGEAVGDASQIANERRALQGAMGQRAREEAEARIGPAPDSERMTALQNARDDIGRRFDAQGQLIVDSPEIGGNLLQRSVQDARRLQRGQVDQAYRDFRNVEGEFNPEIFEMPVGERVSAYAFPENGGFRFNDRRMPEAAGTLDYLNSLSEAARSGRPITVQAMDDARREIVSAEKIAKKAANAPGGDGSDWAAMQRIRHGFDEFMEDAFQLGHFSGDAQEASSLYRAARETNRAYREAFFQRNSGDIVGREMEKIFGRTPDQALEPHTIIRNILGAPATMGQKDLAPKMIRRLADVLGEGSAEFSGLRQSAFQILTEFGEGRTSGKVAKDIRTFLDGYGRRSSEALFDPSMRSIIRRYGDLMERITPPPGTIQTSNHHVMWRRALMLVPAILAGAFGFSTGGVGLGLGAAAATGAMQAVKPILDARKVARWMPTFNESFERWSRAQNRAARNGSPMDDRILAAAGTNLANSLSKLGLDGSAIMKEINASRPVSADEDEKKKRKRD